MDVNDDDLLTMNFANVEELKEYIRENGEKNKKVLLKDLKNDGLYLKYAYYKLRADKDVVLTAVRENGLTLEFAHPKLRDDRDVVLAAVVNQYWDTNGFNFASNRLKQDKYIVFISVSIGGISLLSIPEVFRDDEDIISFIVKSKGHMLKYASDRLKDDKKVVLSAISNNGNSINYASCRLRDDEEVILSAIHRSKYSLQFASDRLKTNKDFILNLIKYFDVILFSFIHKNLKNDENFIFEAFKINTNILTFLSSRLKDDECFLCYLDQITKLTSIEHFGFEFVSKRILEKLKEDSDYLTEFLPVYIKPSKNDILILVI